MNFTGLTKRQMLVRWAERLRDIARQRGDEAAATEIEAAIQELHDQRFVITILGKAKRGKSTLINALLGRKDDVVAPIDKLPASSAISRFHYSDTDDVCVSFQGGRTQKIPFPEIRSYVTEELNPENHKGVLFLDIQGRFGALEHDLVFVDTPGTGSIHQHHDAIVHEFLPQSDAVIFLVTARSPIDQDEIELLGSVKSADIRKIFFVMNRIDESTEADLRDAEKHNRNVLAHAGIDFGVFHGISAKRAFAGDVGTSGVPGLAEDIQKFLAANKAAFIETRFKNRVCRTIMPVATGLDVELFALERTQEEVAAQLASLESKRQFKLQNQGLVEKTFQLNWRRAVDDFGAALPSIKSDVRANITSQLQNTSLVTIGSFGKKFPTKLSDAVEKLLSPEVDRLERSMREACTKLEADYPSLRLDLSGGTPVSVRGDGSVAKTTLGGLAAIGAGVGFAGVGSATAATIAAANVAAGGTVTAVAVPTALSGLLGSIPTVGGFLSQFAVGQAVVSTPAALTAMPFWVALAGPVGWTVAGIGAIAIPLAWRSSRLRAKDDLEIAGREQVNQLFDQLERDRIPQLNKMGDRILEEFRLNSEREGIEIENALVSARAKRNDQGVLRAIRSLTEEMKQLLKDEFAGTKKLDI